MKGKIMNLWMFNSRTLQMMLNDALVTLNKTVGTDSDRERAAEMAQRIREEFEGRQQRAVEPVNWV
jgi:hypothetical protein